MDKNYQIKGTRYWVYNDDKTLPTIVMVHGFRGTHHGLDLIAKEIKGYRLIVPDLPGFGESQPLEAEHSLDNYVSWLYDFIKELKLSEKPILFGHSFGSIIASAYATKYPSTITKLVLLNPIAALASKGIEAIPTKFALFYYWLGSVLPDKLATKVMSSKLVIYFISALMTKSHDKKMRNFVLNQHLQHFNSFYNCTVVKEAFQASSQNSVREFAPNIHMPTLLIIGKKDDVVPLKQQYALAKLMPTAKLVEFDKVGHLTHYETPDKVARAIESFLR